MAHTVVKSGLFWLVEVYAPNDQMEIILFFRQLRKFLVDSARLVLIGDWNVIMDPKLNRVRGASGSLSDRSLIDLINNSSKSITRGGRCGCELLSLPR